MHPELGERAPVPDSQPIVLLERYELLRSVGLGGMAEVFEGYDHLLDRPVAVKILRDRYTLDPDFVDRFLREASATAGLSHPNVAAVFDAGSDQDRHFIVMEFVRGQTLREVLEERGRLPVPAAAAVVGAAATALDAAHAAGLVHRDVKPGNIMVTPDTVKVVDFGIARVADDDPTVATNVLGTPSYLSPEQAQGGRVDARSDVYGLGVCLYELLTGVPPFNGESAFAIAYQHVHADPRPPRELRAELPAALEAVVLRAMAKDPDARYQSAGDMRAALELAMAVTSTAAAGAAASPAQAPPPAAAAATPLAAMAASTVPSIPVVPPAAAGRRVRPAPARPRRTPARARARPRQPLLAGRRPALLLLAGLFLAALVTVVAVPALRGDDVFKAVPPAGVGQAAAADQDGGGRMPYLRGLSLAAARAELRAAGLTAEPVVKGRADAAVPAGLVLASSPGPDASLAPGTPVTLLVSLGKAAAAPGTTSATTAITATTPPASTSTSTSTTATPAPPSTTAGASQGRGRGRGHHKGRGQDVQD